jgi:hypothetical protein
MTETLVLSLPQMQIEVKSIREEAVGDLKCYYALLSSQKFLDICHTTLPNINSLNLKPPIPLFPQSLNYDEPVAMIAPELKRSSFVQTWPSIPMRLFVPPDLPPSIVGESNLVALGWEWL